MLETLTAIREKKSTYNCITTLKDSSGKVKTILTGYRIKSVFIVVDNHHQKFSL